MKYIPILLKKSEKIVHTLNGTKVFQTYCGFNTFTQVTKKQDVQSVMFLV